MLRRVLLLNLVVLALGACAGSKKSTEPPPPPSPPTEALAWVPGDASLVGRIVLEPFRASTLWSFWSEIEARSPGVAHFINIALVDEITVGGYIDEKNADGTLPPPRMIVALRGRFGEGYLEKLAATQNLPVTPRGLLRVVSQSDALWAQVSPELLITFSEGLAERTIARASEGPAVPVRSGALFTTLATKVGFDTNDLAFLAEDLKGAGRAQLREQGMPNRVSRLTDSLSRIAVSIDVAANITVKVVGEAPDPAKATEVEDGVNDQVASLGNNMFVGLLGLRPIITAFKASSGGNFVEVNGSVPEKDLTPVLQKLSSMLQMATESGLAPP